MQNSQYQRFGETPTESAGTSGMNEDMIGKQSGYTGPGSRMQAGTYGSVPVGGASMTGTPAGGSAMGGAPGAAPSPVAGGLANEFGASTTAQSFGSTGSYGGASSMPATASGYGAGSLTQAGVSNFSQQVNNAYQQLQKVGRELNQAQNQIEIQAQAQVRQMKQLQQLIDAAANEIQRIDSLSRGQGTRQ